MKSSTKLKTIVSNLVLILITVCWRHLTGRHLNKKTKLWHCYLLKWVYTVVLSNVWSLSSLFISFLLTFLSFPLQISQSTCWASPSQEVLNSSVVILHGISPLSGWIISDKISFCQRNKLDIMDTLYIESNRHKGYNKGTIKI